MINAEEASRISTINQEKFEIKKARHLTKDMNRVSDSIESASKQGHYTVRWDYRDAMNKEQVKQILIAEGFKIDDAYPYFLISWEKIEGCGKEDCERIPKK
jgi:hypothetical protein